MMPRDELLHLSLVLVPIWLAMLMWFSGIALRLAGKPRLFDYCWLVGAGMLVIHIIASYGIVHQWSHAAALKATGQESLAATGIEADWGVYVNFAFAVIWLAYVLSRFAGIAVHPFCERCIFVFHGLIVFSATVVFEPGWVRWLSLTAFIMLGIQVYAVRRSNIQKRSSDG